MKSIKVFSFNIILLLIVTNTCIVAQSLRSKINNGNEKYNEEKYEEALNLYQDALIDDPQNAIAHFNRGAAFYKMEKYDKAIEEYQKALSIKDVKKEAKIHYNIGNAYFKQDKLQESIESYIIALDINPDDEDVKYNLELARAKLKELADKKQTGENQKQEKIDPSEFAKELKKKAEELVEEGKFSEALNLMMQGAQKDKTVAAYQAFTKRLNDVVQIAGGN